MDLHQKQIHYLLNNQGKQEREFTNSGKLKKKNEKIHQNLKNHQILKNYKNSRNSENSQNSEKCEIFSKILTNFLPRTPNS